MPSCWHMTPLAMGTAMVSKAQPWSASVDPLYQWVPSAWLGMDPDAHSQGLMCPLLQCLGVLLQTAQAFSLACTAEAAGAHGAASGAEGQRAIPDRVPGHRRVGSLQVCSRHGRGCGHQRQGRQQVPALRGPTRPKPWTRLPKPLQVTSCNASAEASIVSICVQILHMSSCTSAPMLRSQT